MSSIYILVINCLFSDKSEKDGRVSFSAQRSYPAIKLISGVAEYYSLMQTWKKPF